MITIKDAEKMAKFTKLVEFDRDPTPDSEYEKNLVKAWQEAGLVEPCLKSKLLELTDIIDNEYGEKYDDDRIYKLTQMIKQYFEEKNDE
jgi:hypothetical protein